jgi:hypothetical protein
LLSFGVGYVSHPFPAQGRTTDTAHLIVEGHASAEGSYVALTRARERTNVYAAASELDIAGDPSREDTIVALAERLGRSEREIASISVPLAHEQQVAREHDRETRPGRDRSPRQHDAAQLALPLDAAARDSELDSLRGERDRLRDVVATYPGQQAEVIGEIEREIDTARQTGASARERADRLQTDLAQMSPLARRRDLGRRTTGHLHDAEKLIDTAREREQTGQARIDALQQRPDSPASWEQQHPDAREQLQAAQTALEDALDRHANQAIQHPGEHLTRILGERSALDAAPEREAWDHGARAVERYRIAHHIDPNEQTALGPQPHPGRSTWEQRHDWHQAGEQVIQARQQLDIDPTGHGPTEQRPARIDGLTPEHDRDLDHGHEWER